MTQSSPGMGFREAGAPKQLAFTPLSLHQRVLLV